MITYELNIKSLEYEPSLSGLTNVVTYIYYECIATSDENNKTLIQQGKCKAPDISQGIFIDGENLTLDEVSKWVSSSEEYIRTKMALAYRLEPSSIDSTSPISSTRIIDYKLPWNK